jgi:hypothetical protein
MSTAPATEDADAGELAAAVRSAPFVRVVAAATGDSLAASGVLVRALRERATPFQVRVDPVPDPLPGDGGELVVGVGVRGGDIALADDEPASVAAAETARELGADPDPILALAGVRAAGRPVGEAASLLEAAERRTGIDRRPGVAVPTPDLADGLAHSTLVVAPMSGDADAARATLDDLAVAADADDETRRRLASWLVVEASASSARAAEAVERAVHPYETPGGRFATVGGFGDVLDAAARERPGTGVALAIRDDESTRSAVLDAWRTHGRAAHTALADATTGRYDGLLVVRVEACDPGRLGTVARLCRDFRSPEPVVLAVADEAAATAGTEAVGLDRTLADAVEAVDVGGRSVGGSRRATARFDDAVDVSRLITAFREAL